MPQLWAWIQRDIWRLRAPWPARHFWVVSKQPESNRLSWNNFRQPREGCYKLHGKDDWPVRQEWSNHCTESRRKHPKKSWWAFLSHPWVRAWGAKGVDRARSVIFCDQLFCCINFILSSPFWTTLLWTNFWWGHLFWQYSTSLSRSVCGTHSCSWVSLGSCCYTLSQVISTSLLDHLITFITWPSANNVTITHS